MSDAIKSEGASSVGMQGDKSKTSYLGLLQGVLQKECEMPATRILVLCAGPGMGKTTVLNRLVFRCKESGIAGRYYDYGGLNPDEAYVRFKEALRWFKNNAKGSSEHGNPLVACDNVPVGDEYDVDRLCKLVRRLVEEGGSVALGILPEDELLVEQLGEARCLWACELRYPRPIDTHAAEIYDLYTQGVPLLTTEIEKMDPQHDASVPMDMGYQEAYLSLVEHALRPGMIDEEKRLRWVMLLMGSGARHDVERVLGNLDGLLWRLLARDAPFFGISRTQNTFCCVGGHSIDCLNIAYSALYAMSKHWINLIAGICRVLAKRGDFARVAVVSLMCADDAERCSIGLEWGMRMIDAGEVSVAEDALEVARALGGTSLPGYRETSCALASLGRRHAESRDLHLLGPRDGGEAIVARLAMGCRMLLRGKRLSDGFMAVNRDDTLAKALLTHGQALQLMIDAKLEEAYELLLACPIRLESSSISCAVVEVDYALCSLLVGMVPGPLDMEALQAAGALFERAGLTQCIALRDAAVAMGRLLGGRAVPTEAFEIHIERATRSNDTLLRGVFLLAAGVSDMRIGALTRCYVRLEQAKDAFTATGAEALKKTAILLNLAVRSQLGERITSSEMRPCEGISQNMDKVVFMLGEAVSAKSPKSPSMRGWETPQCPRDIFWIVNVLTADCNVISHRFKRMLPRAWRSSVLKASAKIDEFFGDGASAGNDVVPKRSRIANTLSETGTREGTPIEIRMLGGFEVHVGGNALPGNRLDRRRAKAVLALLVAMPGHAAKRFSIMETVWPTYDYSTANKCLYSATSVLRSELSAALGDVDGIRLVLANKAEGTVSLDKAYIGCDVDRFEKKARKLLDLEGVDHRTVAMCREVEELYRGDLFVPPTDGMGIIQSRAQQLKELYADAMVAGSMAAHRMGMKSLACRFARKAYEADDLREDAVRAIVISLCAAGRHIEAERRYERFVGRVVDLTKRPPSRRLRELVDSVLRDSTVGTRQRRRASLDPQAKVHVLKEDKTLPTQLAFSFDDAGSQRESE